VAQWEMVKLLAPDTLIVMSDVKQTIHKWRGANPEQRLKELRDFAVNTTDYKGIAEYTLAVKHRTPKAMSDNENITRVYVSSDDPNNSGLPKNRTKWKCKNVLRDFTQKSVGILCVSNILANDITNSLRRTQYKKNGTVFGYPMNYVRLGSDNSPFDTVRSMLHKLLWLVDDRDRLRMFVANDLFWSLLPLPKSKLPKCGQRSKRDEPAGRWCTSGALAVNICTRFGLGLLSLRESFLEAESTYACRCDRAILNCINHVGRGVLRLGGTWDNLSSQERTTKIDSLVMQYENAYASYQKKSIRSVMTVHQSKGREFDVVVVPWFSTIKWDERDSFSWDTSQEEIANVFHTACTRAKEEVVVIVPKDSEAQWPPA